MFNVIAVMAILALPSQVFAAPNMSCTLAWFKHHGPGDPPGTQVEMVSAEITEVGKKVVLHVRDYALTTELQQVCAADGGPCGDGYDLTTSLSKDNVTSRTSSSTPFYRQYLALQWGDETVHCWCFNNGDKASGL